MTHRISNTPVQAVHSTSFKQAIGEKKTEASIKIQRFFRNKLSAAEPHILSKVKNIQRVPENYHPVFLDDSLIDKRWKNLTKFAEPLKKDHYVFAHASSFAHGFFVDLRTHLSSSLFPATSSRWITHRKFRTQDAPQSYKNVSEYFKSALCKNINLRLTSDNKNRSVILSCDGYLNSKESVESAFSFFQKNTSIFHPNNDFRNSVFKEHIHNIDISKFASDYYEKTNSLTLHYRWGQGRVYFIAIPKETLQNEKTCYVWRSHTHGMVCNPPPSTTETPHQEFIEVLAKHQKGKSVSHHNKDCQAQYRMLAANLDRDLTKKIFAVDSLSKSQKELYKKYFWTFASLLKQIQRLESISKATSQKDLVSILLRIRFDAKHLPSVTSENNTLYKRGLRSILNNKKDILIKHKAYLRKNLPQNLLEDLRKVGISL